ncbi:MAG: HD domain-containing protein [Chloroflexi bacterium]|nr:HD domain-containing protein [Chloroflexota bacterium]
MAELPVPGRSNPDAGLRDGAAFTVVPLPEEPRAALRTLIDAGHEAVLVGGCVRDEITGRGATDWDIATSAPPEAVSELFPGSHWENRFGTVTLPGRPLVEITSYRTESGYRDRRRPDAVEFGASLAGDLGRRDFTINAIAWRPDDLAAGRGTLVDPHAGIDDLRAGVVRAVGDADERFGEDALRLLRAVRFSLRLGFAIDPATEAALAQAARSAADLSAERVRDELLRLLDDPSIAPSIAFARWEELGLLGVLLPELAALRGVPQGKPRAGDALDHSLRTADALPATDRVLRLAGLLHDLGKAATLADGHFIGHEQVGAEMTAALMHRLRFPEREVESVVPLVRAHMFDYQPSWTDAAVRRFIGRVGLDRLDALFALRAADSAASGVGEPTSGGTDELRERIAGQRRAPLETRQLAIDGHDLQRELGLEPGPGIGRVLASLLESVLDDPSRNERETLLAMAREMPARDPQGH